jgi:hypothetical protein
MVRYWSWRREVHLAYKRIDYTFSHINHYITSLKNSYRLSVCLNACDPETLTIRHPKPELGCYSTGKDIYIKSIFNELTDQNLGTNRPLKVLRFNAKYLFNSKFESTFPSPTCRLNFLVMNCNANFLLHIVTLQNITRTKWLQIFWGNIPSHTYPESGCVQVSN